MSSLLYANPLLIINFIDTQNNPLSLENIEKSSILKPLVEQLKSYPLILNFDLNGHPIETIFKFDPNPGNVASYQYVDLAKDLVFDLASPYPLTKINSNGQQTFKFQLPAVFNKFLGGQDFSLDFDGGQTLENCLGYDLGINLTLKVGEQFGTQFLSGYQFEISKDSLKECSSDSYFKQEIKVNQNTFPIDQLNQYNQKNVDDFKKDQAQLSDHLKQDQENDGGSQSFKLLWWHILIIIIGTLLVLGVSIKLLWPHLKKLKI